MSVVYFIATGSHIKIGTSTNLASRLASLQTSTVDDLRVLGTIPGDAAIERAIHGRLAKYRKRGEWFLDCAEVRATVVDLCGSDVFEVVERPPQPTPLGSLSKKLSEIVEKATGRYIGFSKFCLDGCETDKTSKLWRLHVAKRHLIVAAISQAERAIDADRDRLLFDDEDIDAAGRCVASTEMCECQVEMILGEDIWFLGGWERQPRSNPLFETLNGKPMWQSREAAVVEGWTPPPSSFQEQIEPWMEELRSRAA